MHCELGFCYRHLELYSLSVNQRGLWSQLTALERRMKKKNPWAAQNPRQPPKSKNFKFDTSSRKCRTASQPLLYSGTWRSVRGIAPAPVWKNQSAVFFSEKIETFACYKPQATQGRAVIQMHSDESREHSSIKQKGRNIFGPAHTQGNLARTPCPAAPPGDPTARAQARLEFYPALQLQLEKTRRTARK